MANSENGWPLVVEAQLEPLAWLPNNARLLAGPVAQVLGYVARQFAARVEPITSTSSFRPKATIGSGSTYSNHASGTALDMNGGRHPQGSKDTFTDPQVGAIRQILAECSGVLRWGGDYAMPITDEMHFEIRPGATAAQVAAAAAALTTNTPNPEEDMPLNDADKSWMTGEVHRVVLEILRAPEFQLNDIPARVLAAKVSDDTGTLAQTVRDARQIARRTEIAVQNLSS
ncbi:M15 family metallopeptidase [Cellulomonas fimi]|uniref:M15 family metallopeptidase n=1 Tax=Cellulomonas sp. RIT-PI-Y TaxID=3035297 RepID=UPI0021DAF981